MSAWIDTSSAATTSSQTISLGSQRQRAGDVDALLLAAGHLVRIALARTRRASADAVEHLRAPCVALGARADAQRCRAARARCRGCVMRGSSAALGSWKMIWNRAGGGAARAPTARYGSLARAAARAAGRLQQADHARGPSVDLPEPDSPMTPKVSPRRTAKLTPSTALTVSRRLRRREMDVADRRPSTTAAPSSRYALPAAPARHDAQQRTRRSAPAVEQRLRRMRRRHARSRSAARSGSRPASRRRRHAAGDRRQHATCAALSRGSERSRPDV